MANEQIQVEQNPILRARDVLVEIANNNDGRITPEIIVARASDPTHPLHDRFEWDDAVAGQRFRLLQAAIMIRACKIKIDMGNGPRIVRELVSVERGDHVYHHMRVISDDVDRRNMLLEQAYRDLQTFTKRYEDLASIFQESIEKLKAAIANAIETNSDEEVSTEAS